MTQTWTGKDTDLRTFRFVDGGLATVTFQADLSSVDGFRTRLRTEYGSPADTFETVQHFPVGSPLVRRCEIYVGDTVTALYWQVSKIEVFDRNSRLDVAVASAKVVAELRQVGSDARATERKAKEAGTRHDLEKL